MAEGDKWFLSTDNAEHQKWIDRQKHQHKSERVCAAHVEFIVQNNWFSNFSKIGEATELKRMQQDLSTPVIDTYSFLCTIWLVLFLGKKKNSVYSIY